MATINDSPKSKLYLSPFLCEDLTKDKLRSFYLRFKFLQTCKMFKWENLPETIENKDFEYILQTFGYAVFKKVDGEYYVFYGGLGGVPNEYYHPTKAIIANPYLRYFDTLEIDTQCVVALNDSLYMGLYPLNTIYANLLAENTLSLKWAMINTRTANFLVAQDDSTKESMEKVLQKIIMGEDLGVIGSNSLFEGAKNIPFAPNQTAIKDLLEARQYLQANWLIDLGLNSNFNMKRENLNENELNVNELSLLPLIDDMLEQRKIACDKINKMYGLNLSVDLSSAWKKLRKDLKQQEEIKESQIEESRTEEEPKTKKEPKNGGEENV